MAVILGLAGGIVLLAACLALIIYFFFPRVILMMAQSSDASKAGLKNKTLSLDGYDVHYYDGGEGPALILLHGMSDEKNSFVKTVSALTATHRVILPDLKGHGENERRAGLDYSIGGQVDYLHAFTKALGLSSFSIGGNSMGGHIAVAYATHYPGKAENLIIVNAPGLVLDDSEAYAGFERPLETREDFMP